MKKAVLLCGSGSAVEFQFSMSSSACLRNNHKPNLHNNGLNQKCKKQQQTLPLMMINLRSHGRKYYLFNNIVFHSTAARILLSEALHKLSLIPRQVVATGGGTVVRPINCRYMRHGISVFLDAPLDALARRIAAVGTDSRPLLEYDSGEGDAYSKAFMGLLPLSKKRDQAYANADATVSLLSKWGS
ncbi:Shikimate kinase, chloroplastic [Melia azedarach]|uniref:Shikimate kinase, chloroplastic n=1 Tax=Melia azedarach TaxID=155640 RepID=A0ACC1WQJ8_MELAZ|nr:Shikimate kinase, chloroplastic [Melia azedarach]